MCINSRTQVFTLKKWWALQSCLWDGLQHLVHQAASLRIQGISDVLHVLPVCLIGLSRHMGYLKNLFVGLTPALKLVRVLSETFWSLKHVFHLMSIILYGSVSSNLFSRGPTIQRYLHVVLTLNSLWLNSRFSLEPKVTVASGAPSRMHGLMQWLSRTLSDTLEMLVAEGDCQTWEKKRSSQLFHSQTQSLFSVVCMRINMCPFTL